MPLLIDGSIRFFRPIVLNILIKNIGGQNAFLLDTIKNPKKTAFALKQRLVFFKAEIL